jgi:hypothetical protein
MLIKRDWHARQTKTVTSVCLQADPSQSTLFVVFSLMQTKPKREPPSDLRRRAQQSLKVSSGSTHTLVLPSDHVINADHEAGPDANVMRVRVQAFAGPSGRACAMRNRPPAIGKIASSQSQQTDRNMAHHVQTRDDDGDLVCLSPTRTFWHGHCVEEPPMKSKTFHQLFRHCFWMPCALS